MVPATYKHCIFNLIPNMFTYGKFNCTLNLTVFVQLSKGMCVEVKESQMNAVSSVSGCGLAFLFLAIEAMSDGGVRVGLPRALSTDLATQAFIGAARLVQETGKHPGQVGQCM